MEFHLNKEELNEAGEEVNSNPLEKGIAFKVADESQADISGAFSHGDIADMSKEELKEFALTLVCGFNTSNSRAAKYKRFYKKQQGQQNRSQGKGKAKSSARGSSGVKYNVKCFECHKVGLYKSECPSLSEKEREEIKARQKTRKAYIAEEASVPIDGLNHDEDRFTDDDDEANQISLDMGMFTLDEDEPEFNLMAMSDANSEDVTDKVISCELKDSSTTLAHVQCVADTPQENEDDVTSHYDDNELLSDYLNIVENNEALQSLVSRYMSDNAKLTQELISLKGKHSEIAHEHNDYVALQASHKQFEQKF